MKPMPRRSVLRGILAGSGVALALPLFEAMLNEHGTALANGGEIPKRFGVWFWGNGTHPGNWAPAVTGPGWEPSPLLSGLAAVKDYINVISGGVLPTTGSNNPHVEGAVGILAGGNPLLHPSYNGQGGDWDFLTVPSASVDEVAASHLGDATTFRNLAAAVTPVHTSDAGSVNAPGTAISYISHPAPYVFNPPMLDPSVLFSYLFGAGIPTGEPPQPASLARARVLDAILEDAHALDARLGASDRQRLEQHLDGIDRLQQQLTTIVMPGEACAQLPDPGNPQSNRDRARVMADLLAMAFACDLSRVMTLQFSSPASHVDYPDIGVASANLGTSFHEYQHQQGYNATVVTTLGYFMDVFSDFVSALAALPEAGGNLLDHSCILGTSDVSGGWDHAMTDFPLLVAGRAGGALTHPGTHVSLAGGNASRVPLTCLRAIGAPVEVWGSDQFATSDPIAELLT
jgi:hypothetical protein